MTFRIGFSSAAVAIILSATASAALASGSSSATISPHTVGTAPASVTVLAPVTLTKTPDMAFGQVVRPSNANTNTVILNVNDAVSITGAGNGALIASPTTSAKFNINAPSGTTYTTVQTLSFAQTGLLNISPSLPVATTGVLGTIPVAGVQEIRYGGQFDMNASTTAQSYTGTLSVTVNYN